MAGIYGVGYNSGREFSTHCDEDGLSAGRSRAYVVWRSILMRCYQKNHHTLHKRGSSYKGHTVCEDWFDFQQFASWFYTNYKQGWEIDKDLIGDGSNIYSPATCVFLPPGLNSEIKIPKKRELLPGCVKVGKRYLCPDRSTHLSELLCFKQHIKQKQARINQKISEHKDDLSDAATVALHRFVENLEEFLLKNYK